MMRSIFALTLIALAAAAAAPAHANWAFSSSAQPGDFGSAYVKSDSGVTLDVGCGNDGTVAISFRPDPRPENLKQSNGPVFVFGIDERAFFEVPLECNNTECFQAQMLRGEIWPVEKKAEVINALREGSRLWVRVSSRLIAAFPLQGSEAALDTLASRTSCEGL